MLPSAPGPFVYKDAAARPTRGGTRASAWCAGAFASFMSVLAADPAHLPALLELASLYKARGLLQEARDVLERAVKAAPADERAGEGLATVLTDLGTAAKVSGRLDEAVQLYHAALRVWPTLAAAHYNLVRTQGGCDRGGNATALAAVCKNLCLVTMLHNGVDAATKHCNFTNNHNAPCSHARLHRGLWPARRGVTGGERRSSTTAAPLRWRLATHRWA
jgi:hypothetical protein